jgi:hypothetical protein
MRSFHKCALLVASLIAAGALTDSGPLLLGAGSAEAVIGRPLTPVSYAGVARRTTRRTVAATAYAQPVYQAPVVQTTVVVSQPSGCGAITTGGVVVCNGVQYEASYNGPNLVYRQL